MHAGVVAAAIAAATLFVSVDRASEEPVAFAMAFAPAEAEGTAADGPERAAGDPATPDMAEDAKKPEAATVPDALPERAEVPAEAAVENPVEAPMKTPVDVPVGVPVEVPREVPTDARVEVPELVPEPVERAPLLAPVPEVAAPDAMPPEDVPRELVAIVPPEPPVVPPAPVAPPQARPAAVEAPRTAATRPRRPAMDAGPARGSAARPDAEAAAPGATESTAPPMVISRSWQAALAAWLHRNKHYPAEARARGEQGAAQVSFTVARDGAVSGVTIRATTGSVILDDAVRTLLSGAHVPPFPPDMPHASVTVSVQIVYRLDR